MDHGSSRPRNSTIPGPTGQHQGRRWGQGQCTTVVESFDAVPLSRTLRPASGSSAVFGCRMGQQRASVAGRPAQSVVGGNRPGGRCALRAATSATSARRTPGPAPTDRSRPAISGTGATADFWTATNPARLPLSPGTAPRHRPGEPRRTGGRTRPDLAAPFAWRGRLDPSSLRTVDPAKPTIARRGQQEMNRNRPPGDASHASSGPTSQGVSSGQKGSRPDDPG